MSFYSKGTPYLAVLPTGRFQFRIRIPLELQRYLGQREYRRSLGRRTVTEAKTHALRLAAAAQEIFAFTSGVIDGRKSPARGTSCSVQVVESLTGQRIMTDSQGGTSPAAASPIPGSLGIEGQRLESLTDDEIRAIAETWLLAALKGSNLFAMQYAHLGQQYTQTGDDLHDSTQANAETAGKLRAIYHTDLKARRLGRIAKATDKQLYFHSVVCDKQTETAAAFEKEPPAASPAYLKACQEMMKANVTFYDIQEQAVQGNFETYDAEVERLEAKAEQRREKRRIRIEDTTKAAPIPSPSGEETAEPSLTVTDAIAMYRAERIQERIWSDHTANKQQDKFDLFREIIDPDNTFPLGKLRAEHMREYKAILFGLPTNRNKGPKYKDIPFPKLMDQAKSGAIPEADRIQPGTIRNHFQQITAFLNWAARNEFHSNPKIADLLDVKMDKQAHEHRDPYNREDLLLVFNPTKYHKATQFNRTGDVVPHRFWLPLLGLFTGARIEELAQLHTEDIVVFDTETKESRPAVSLKAEELRTAVAAHGQKCHFCLDTHISRPYQTIKNPASARLIPLSPALVHDFNFIGYVLETAKREASTDSADKGRLFPELSKQDASKRFSHNASKWYGNYRKAIGLSSAQGGKKDFHSFRDTIAQWCDLNNIPLKTAKRYIGHAEDDMTYGRYSTESPPWKLYDEITEPFTEYVCGILDLSSLKTSPVAQHAI
ncbi:hypothetical protein KL86DPRO_10369 [uncultured delta proteobacterium]|uniref:DUF6538 domain-containing protein n=1 Tax=uncultured delta proteobacterium TaxID=34034 RepID=A0A212IZ49_9DELT|nr:hypothetical protein KL86DPRO_10369 [uncultured delta proteobacterium]